MGIDDAVVGENIAVPAGVFEVERCYERGAHRASREMVGVHYDLGPFSDSAKRRSASRIASISACMTRGNSVRSEMPTTLRQSLVGVNTDADRSSRRRSTSSSRRAKLSRVGSGMIILPNRRSRHCIQDAFISQRLAPHRPFSPVEPDSPILSMSFVREPLMAKPCHAVQSFPVGAAFSFASDFCNEPAPSGSFSVGGPWR